MMERVSYIWKPRAPSFWLVISLIGLVLGTPGWIISGVLAANAASVSLSYGTNGGPPESLTITAARGETLTWTIHVGDGIPGYWASDTGLVLSLDGDAPSLVVLRPQPDTWDQAGSVEIFTTGATAGLTITTTLTIPASISGPDQRSLSGSLAGTLEYPSETGINLGNGPVPVYVDQTLDINIPVHLQLVSSGLLPWVSGLLPSYLFAGEDLLSGVVLLASLVLMRRRHIASGKGVGRVWQSRTLNSQLTLHGVAWTGANFLAVGDQGTILFSPNGQMWTKHPSGTSRHLLGVACSTAHRVAVGEAGTILLSSAGGSWTAQPSGTLHTLHTVTWTGTQFVAVGDEGAILTSPEGNIWTVQPSGTSHRLLGIAHSDAQVVVVGASGTILTSLDGRTWTAQSSGTSQTLYAIACSGAQFVAVGNNGTLLTSSNGSIWTVQRPLSQAVFDIVWTGTQFVGVGRGGIIFTSPTGKEWTTSACTFRDLYGTAWSGYRLVVVGEKGTILTSG